MATATPRKNRTAPAGSGAAESGQDRLYKNLARALFLDLANGKYSVGDRLPAERELAAKHHVSRPTVREAIIALEVQGLIEVRVGSGAYVRRLPGAEDSPGFNVTAFELTEARLVIEGEAAALAAVQVSEGELDELDALVRRIADENLRDQGTVNADREAFEGAIRDLDIFLKRWPTALRSLITGRYKIDQYRDLLLGKATGIKNIIALA